MTPEQIERVFGRGRLKMVTGEHVEVFREAVAPGERRRYTKRFLNTREGDFGQWTEREWRILARLIGHGITCVPEVVQFDRGGIGGMRIVQTYDAGVTVDQWATLLPVIRDDRVHRHVFEDCAHWWALAHHCLRALEEIHRLELVHLDIKGDNLCIPYAPANFDPESPDPALRPVFAQFALIDFAFALVSKESLTTPLPIGWQREYDYQSPRLLAALERGRSGDLQATRELDWRCDMYSLAAMLKRYLPDAGLEVRTPGAAGWTPERYDAAKALILRIREAHDGDAPPRRPHADLIEATGARLAEPEVVRSLERGWSLARELSVSAAHASPLTPVTRVAPVTRIATPIRVARSGRTAVTVVPGMERSPGAPPAGASPTPATPLARHGTAPRRRSAIVAALTAVALTAVALLGVGAALWYAGAGGVSSRADFDAMLAPLQATAKSAAATAARILHGDRAPNVAEKGVAAPAPEAASGATHSTRVVAVAAESGHPSAPSLRDAPRESGQAAQTAAAVTAPPVASSRVSSLAEPALAMAPRAPVPAEPAPAAARERPRVTSTRAPGNPTPRPQRASARNQAIARAPPSRSAVPAERAHAPWASLQPPAWVTSHAHSPGNPPGFKAPEPDLRVAAATEVAAAVSAASEPRASEPAPIAPSATAATAATAAVAAASQPAALAPLPGVAAGDERRAAARPPIWESWLAARSAAPVEDRSPTLAPSPPREPRRAAAVDPPPDELAVQAQRLLADTVPRVARQGEREISRVLLIAASAYQPVQDRSLADAARLARIRDEGALSVRAAAPAEARRLHGEARAAFASTRNVRRALDLELRAFAADPRDPEIAGDLALLYLKTTPSQPETARQVALVALTARSPQYATTRLEDWQAFAVASALSGHETDARNALFVTLALSANTERICVSGWNALADYGERMRGPVEALLYRVHMRGHSVDSPWCAWPPHWSAPPRLAGNLSP